MSYQVFDSPFIASLASAADSAVVYDAAMSGAIPAKLLELRWHVDTKLWRAVIEITATASENFTAGERLDVAASLLLASDGVVA